MRRILLELIHLLRAEQLSGIHRSDNILFGAHTAHNAAARLESAVGPRGFNITDALFFWF